LEQLDRIGKQKASNKHGMLNRLNIDKEKYEKMHKGIQDQYIGRQILNECTPVEIRKIAAESDLAFSKLMEINNNLDPEDYGSGVYFNMPDIIRGRERML
jgi:hypothetical protein